jgi:hypothetical protein
VHQHIDEEKNCLQFFDLREVSENFDEKTRGGCGHSCQETPGLIPNPVVKLAHVVCCTEVRESPGTIPSCNHLSFLQSLFSLLSMKERMLWYEQEYR